MQFITIEIFRSHIRSAHNLTGISPRLSPSEEGILSRQLPPSSHLNPPISTNPSPLTTSSNNIIFSNNNDSYQSTPMDTSEKNTNFVVANNVTTIRQMIQPQRVNQRRLIYHIF